METFFKNVGVAVLGDFRALEWPRQKFFCNSIKIHIDNKIMKKYGNVFQKCGRGNVLPSTFLALTLRD